MRFQIPALVGLLSGLALADGPKITVVNPSGLGPDASMECFLESEGTCENCADGKNRAISWFGHYQPANGTCDVESVISTIEGPGHTEAAALWIERHDGQITLHYEGMKDQPGLHLSCDVGVLAPGAACTPKKFSASRYPASVSSPNTAATPIAKRNYPRKRA